jgi:hypothetical protein
MKEELMTDALLREFLLGRLADDETRQRIESLFLTDPHTKETVLAVEQDLIEDYLEDNLTQDERQRFISRYAKTEEQRRNLRITKSIKDWAVAEPKAPPVTTPTVPVWNRLWTQLQFKPVLVVPIAIAIVIAIVLASIWLNSQRERRKHLAIEQELAQLNSPASLREVPAQMISRELKPVTVRSAELQTEISLRSDIHTVQFTLPWIQQERYPAYEAQVRRLDDDESYTIPNLQEVSNEQHVIRLRLLTSMLSPGQYQIHLRGVATDGARSPDEEYSFTVTR